MKAFLLKDDIYWVGAIDWAVRDFHGYVTQRGTSYNNYLIMDDEPTLIDTVKSDFGDITVRNIQGIVDPALIKHVVINHIENDHVTSLDRIMALAPGATIYMTEKGKKGSAGFTTSAAGTSRWSKPATRSASGSGPSALSKRPCCTGPTR